MAKTQHLGNSFSNEKSNITCYFINSLNPVNFKNKNAGNYIGSVHISSNSETKVWLSDGEYMITGTNDNIDIYKSTLTATNNCNE